VAQAGHISRPFSLGDRITVSVNVGVALAARQREPQVVHAVFHGAVGPQPGVGEHLQHQRVLRQRLGGEGTDTPAPGQRDQVLQQQRADTAVMHLIGDRQGHLRQPGPVTGQLPGAATDHVAVQHGQQREMIRAGLAAYPAGLLLGRGRAHTEKPQVTVVRGHLGVQLTHRGEILRPRRPDLDRGAIGQQSINAGPSSYVHIAPGLAIGPPCLT